MYSSKDIIAALSKSDALPKRAKFAGLISIDPRPQNDAFQPASVDLKLGKDFLLPVGDKDRYSNDNQIPVFVMPAHDKPGASPVHMYPYKKFQDEFRLHPGEFVLAATEETVKLGSRIVAKVEGKSSLGRIGLMVHITAGFIDPGFEGQITLEIVNLSKRPIDLISGAYICQISFDTLNSEPLTSYGDSKVNSHYQGQRGVTPSRLMPDITDSRSQQPYYTRAEIADRIGEHAEDLREDDDE